MDAYWFYTWGLAFTGGLRLLYGIPFFNILGAGFKTYFAAAFKGEFVLRLVFYYVLELLLVF